MRKDAGAGDGTLSFVSVVMPTRNEASSIAASLAAVLRQDFPSDRLEVIVADGMSDDRTREVIDAVVDAAGHDTPPVTIIDNPGRIAATGLNAAIAKAQGDVIVRVDGHCEVGSDHVSTCVQLLEQTGADNVGGVVVGGGRSVLQRAVGLGTSSPFGVGNARFRFATKPGWADTVFPGAWPRAVFDRVGGFDEELVRNQDDELNLRIVQAGGRVWLDPRIRTRYEPRDSLAGLWRQYFDYGFHKVRVIQKRRAIASARHVVPPMFVLSVLTVAAAAAIARRPKLLLLVAAPYATATFAASVRAARSDPNAFPALPAVFVTLHVSYGAGFLAGLWRWRHGFRGWRSRTA